MAKVSVIIPTHNRSALLGEAIQSVLDQTFEDFELLVVDDGSKDNPEQVARSFSDPRIHFVRHPVARGGGAARNTGIGNTSGPYVAFLDDDDAWYPEKLALQVALLDQGPANLGLIYGGYDVTDPANDQVLRTRIPTARGNLRERFLRSNVIGGTSLILVRRSCIESVGAFDESLPSFQDYDLYLRLSEHYEFDFVAKAVSRYRRHEVQIWKNPQAVLHGMERMLQKHGSNRRFRHYIARGHQKLGRQLCMSGDLSQGRRVLLRAIRLNPHNLHTYRDVALSLFRPSLPRWALRLKAVVARRRRARTR